MFVATRSIAPPGILRNILRYTEAPEVGPNRVVTDDTDAPGRGRLGSGWCPARLRVLQDRRSTTVYTTVIIKIYLERTDLI